MPNKCLLYARSYAKCLGYDDKQDKYTSSSYGVYGQGRKAAFKQIITEIIS